MDSLPQEFERWYQRAHKRMLALSEHWREHTNRRTIAVSIVVGILALVLYLYVIQPPDAFPTGQLVSVTEGQSVKQIADTLYQDGVIRSPIAFRVIIFVLGHERTARAGDYLFKQPEGIFTIARALANGIFGLEPIKIRIPEGANTAEMGEIFAANLQRVDASDFAAKARSEEGFLFPDTYFFLPNATEDQIIQAMRQNFDSQIETLGTSVSSSTHSLEDIVTMASLLEREARTEQDRRMIAGVLWRRIQMGMPLQVDAAFSYLGIKPSKLTQAELKTDSPYNTYLNKGLPPSPIDSPSLASIEAAADPIDKGYLYYMADSSGVTHYSKSYSGQLANIRTYLGR